MQDRPTIAITMGEPAGIGPEVIVKALADPVLRHKARYVIYGLNELLAYAADLAEFEAGIGEDALQLTPQHVQVGHDTDLEGIGVVGCRDGQVRHAEPFADQPQLLWTDHDEVDHRGVAHGDQGGRGRRRGGQVFL